MKDIKAMISDGIIVNKIFNIRNQKVMLDEDLAQLYEVETKRLNEQVKRNKERFPKDFMFQLNRNEYSTLKSQNATTNWGGRRSLPYAFTEHGVLMISSVLKSKRAIEVNIQIMRIFTKMRKLIMDHKDLIIKIEEIEKTQLGQKQEIKVLFDCIKKLMVEKNERTKQDSRKRIGFKEENM